MAYHITAITNNSSKAIALTNPHNEGDSRLILNGTSYSPDRPVLINKITTSGTVAYDQAAPVAVNLYTVTDNFCFWDNGSSACNGVGQSSSGNISYHTGSAGDLTIIVNPNGSLAFQSA